MKIKLLIYIIKLSILIFVFNYPIKKSRDVFEFDVSIIIPVHNNFNYTYNCIISILNSDLSILYEIIIVNDMSTDETVKLKEKYFKNYSNIIVYNNRRRKNFIINCNKAAKLSRGKYLLFLNNDTKVHKDWLSYLYNLINSDEKIGMAGSKLIYPNGTLQEAGGIVWSNGECSNFGRRKNANMSEYNYVKEVDYISGASIIVRKSAWKKIGGFDRRFVPAYYEDTDFAFELRNHGYKVMYQPKSVVEHFEGISNGRNISTGIKHYQEINKKKFKRKWKNELKFQSKQGNNFIARDRGSKKKRIFVLDRAVPKFDQDAGSRFCFMYLNLFKQMGLRVTFFGDDLLKPEPYTTILQQKGIEILYGDNYNEKNLEYWLKENLKYFNYLYLQRPDITIKYIDILKKYFSGKIFYFAHDLHHIRLEREYNITHSKMIGERCKYMKKIEMEIFNKVDIIHVVGNYEYNILKNKLEGKKIRNIPLYIFDTQYKNIEKDFSKRNDLLFVGGFLHRPNVDGIIWFSKTIYPKVIEKFPNMILHIVGTNITEEIMQLESKNIKIEGFLSDRDLHLIYQKCRVFVIPLRFGAGVKGKILEAAHNQIPIVTTSIGGEGLDNSIGAFIIEDNEDNMAKIICELYVDFNKLKLMSDSGKILIERYFSSAKAKEILMEDMEEI
jgi:GT2 family glycosyltransferase